MGMINHRHDILKRENQALWRVVLQEGGQRLTEKAIYALRQIVRVWRRACRGLVGLLGWSGMAWPCLVVSCLVSCLAFSGLAVVCLRAVFYG